MAVEIGVVMVVVAMVLFVGNIPTELLLVPWFVGGGGVGEIGIGLKEEEIFGGFWIADDGLSVVVVVLVIVLLTLLERKLISRFAAAMLTY